MSWLKSILKALGAAVDAAVPVGVGSRTKIALVACPVLGMLAPVVGLIPGAAPFAPIVPIVQHVLCAAAPAFAVAGLARDL
jgi:hypothetical protein